MGPLYLAEFFGYNAQRPATTDHCPTHFDVQLQIVLYSRSVEVEALLEVWVSGVGPLAVSLSPAKETFEAS